MSLAAVKRKIGAVPRRFREVRMFAKAMRSAKHPILAQIIPTRRCNLACGYCNEYDHVSQPVPIDEMLRRVDQLAALGTSIVTISGGEPLLHPELDLHHRAHSPAQDDCDADHQRLSAECEANPAIEPGGTAPAADQHRQRDAGRDLEEEPEGAGPAAALAGRVCGVRRQHQRRGGIGN